MRRIELTAPALDRFSYLPGQDVSLAFTSPDGSAVRRRYSIRLVDRARRRLEINVLLHGDGPGMRWAQSATPGMAIDAIGPRGKITLAPDADWHLFAGDATAIPAALAMMEHLPRSVRCLAVFLVDNAEERQLFRVDGAQRTIEWRYAEAGADAAQLLDALASPGLPAGRGHAYFAGEVGLVSSLKAATVAWGWNSEQISAKAYWNRGRPNAGHGEPEQKVA